MKGGGEGGGIWSKWSEFIFHCNILHSSSCSYSCKRWCWFYFQPDLLIPDVTRAIAWCNNSLCIGFKREYFLIKVRWLEESFAQEGLRSPSLVRCQMTSSKMKHFLHIISCNSENSTVTFGYFSRLLQPLCLVIQSINHQYSLIIRLYNTPILTQPQQGCKYRE